MHYVKLIYIKYWLLSLRGATAIEYGFIAAAIAVAISVVVFAMGGDLADLFSDSSDKITAEPL